MRLGSFLKWRNLTPTHPRFTYSNCYFGGGEKNCLVGCKTQFMGRKRARINMFPHISCSTSTSSLPPSSSIYIFWSKRPFPGNGTETEWAIPFSLPLPVLSPNSPPLSFPSKAAAAAVAAAAVVVAWSLLLPSQGHLIPLFLSSFWSGFSTLFLQQIRPLFSHKCNTAALLYFE